jgi:hypothetical protein
MKKKLILLLLQIYIIYAENEHIVININDEQRSYSSSSSTEKEIVNENQMKSTFPIIIEEESTQKQPQDIIAEKIDEFEKSLKIVENDQEQTQNNITLIFGRIIDVSLEDINAYVMDRKSYFHIVFLYLRGDYWCRNLALTFEKLPLLFPNLSFISVCLNSPFILNISGRLSSSATVPRILIIHDKEHAMFIGLNKSLERLVSFIVDVTKQYPILNLNSSEDIEKLNLLIAEKKNWPLLDQIGEVSDWLASISHVIVISCLFLWMLVFLINKIIKYLDEKKSKQQTNQNGTKTDERLKTE